MPLPDILPESRHLAWLCTVRVSASCLGLAFYLLPLIMQGVEIGRPQAHCQAAGYQRQ